MDRFARAWLAPWLNEQRGVAWCAAWFALPAIAAFVFALLPETGALARVWLLAIGGLHAFASLGLLRGVKAAWHIAAFLAFATMATRLLAIACAPGEIADGEKHFFAAALDVLVLAIAVLIFTYLRKPGVRSRYGVPESYRLQNLQ